MDVGKWHDSSLPAGISVEDEGLRRPLCDAILLVYYLTISAILPLGDIDLDLAARILKVDLERYPNGTFWLWFSGRLKTMQTEGEEAVAMYNKSIKSQEEYVQVRVNVQRFQTPSLIAR